MEIWKTIELNSNYEVSNLGKIRSKRNCKILKLSTQNGYLKVNLQSKTYRVHRLVAFAFIENLNNKPFINHKNGIKSDNRVTNLEWVTDQENKDHAMKTGLFNQKGSKNSGSILKEADVIRIKELLSKDIKVTEIAKIYMVDHSLISKIKSKKRWAHI